MKTNKHRRLYFLTSVLIFSLLVAACGGGGNNGEEDIWEPGPQVTDDQTLETESPEPNLPDLVVYLRMNPAFRLLVAQDAYVSEIGSLNDDGLSVLQAFEVIGAMQVEEVAVELANVARELDLLSDDGAIYIDVEAADGWTNRERNDIASGIEFALNESLPPTITIDAETESSANGTTQPNGGAGQPDSDPDAPRPPDIPAQPGRNPYRGQNPNNTIRTPSSSDANRAPRDRNQNRNHGTTWTDDFTDFTNIDTWSDEHRDTIVMPRPPARPETPAAPQTPPRRGTTWTDDFTDFTNIDTWSDDHRAATPRPPAASPPPPPSPPAAPQPPPRGTTWTDGDTWSAPSAPSWST